MTPTDACSMSATAVIKTRFPADTVVNLDRLAREVGATLDRKIVRAAVIPALMRLCGNKIVLADIPGLAGLGGLPDRFGDDMVGGERAVKALLGQLPMPETPKAAGG